MDTQFVRLVAGQGAREQSGGAVDGMAGDPGERAAAAGPRNEPVPFGLAAETVEVGAAAAGVRPG